MNFLTLIGCYVVIDTRYIPSFAIVHCSVENVPNVTRVDRHYDRQPLINISISFARFKAE